MWRPDSHATWRHTVGFTLLELVVVLAIIGLLYAIASPRYQQFVLRSNRSEGQALLIDAAARQARYQAQYQTYITRQSEVAKLQLVQPSGSEVLSRSGLYRLVVDSGDGGYLLQAEPQGAQKADRLCGSLLLNGIGTQGITGAGSVAECWK